MLLCFCFTSWKTCDWLLCLWETYIFMSQLFVHWTLHTGDGNRFQSKTKDKHADLIYTYDYVIAWTGVEFRQIGCYHFNFHFLTFFFFYFKILYDLLSFFLLNMFTGFLYVYMNMMILVWKIIHILYN